MRFAGGALLICLGWNAAAQTTQSIVNGRVFDRDTGAPRANAVVRYTELASFATGQAETDLLGYYTLPLLSPGTYRLRVDSPQYQSGEVDELVLFVASRMRLDFPLRQLNRVLESGATSVVFAPGAVAVLPVIGPDFESRPAVNTVPPSEEASTLHPTLSYVIDPALISRLPLPSRDLYTLLVMLPGVTSESATGRGLGLSVNGQRPSSTNFLLDGVENNDYLTTGPFTTIAPEAGREYRVSVNNFSAEYGSTAGALANVVTRSSSNALHGIAYAYLNNDVLNANTFQSNASGVRRTPRKELYAGFEAGGPIIKDRLFWSGAYERHRTRRRDDPQVMQVPLLERFRQYYPNSAATKLLETYPPPVVAAPPVAPDRARFELAAPYTVAAPASLDRSLALVRLDHIWRAGGQRLFARAVVADLKQPDFVYSIYPGFSSPLDTSSVNIAGGYVRQFLANTTSEFRAGYRSGDVGFSRTNPEIPTLTVLSGLVSLPGSEQPTDFRNRDRNFEAGNTTVISLRAHVVTAGGGFLVRRPRSLLVFERDGRYSFQNLVTFAQDRPEEYKVTLSRPEFPDAGFERTRRNWSYYAFVQDSWRVSRRLSLTAGIRYEYFGTLSNAGSPDVVIRPGAGASIVERTRGATRVLEAGALFQPDRNNWAGRGGIAYNIGRGTVLRGAFGVFYDRLFDNLMLASILNAFDSVSFSSPGVVTDFERPSDQVVKSLAGTPATRFALPAVWIDEHVRSPRVQTWFASIERELSRDAVLQISYRGATSGNLISTDQANRFVYGSNDVLNPAFDQLRYRYNGASSDYHALGALLRLRLRRGQLQAAYTLGHTIDTQSEPLLGEFSDFSYARGQQQAVGYASYTRLGDGATDRGSSDFDQRHNLVFFSAWDIPAISGNSVIQRVTENWQFAQIVAIRSGFPYSVYAGCAPQCPAQPSTGVELVRNRASLRPGTAAELPTRVPISGGEQILNPYAFENPPAGEIGNLGRNSLYGPGFWNADISIGRTLRLPKASESVRLQFRADMFNVFNHANLGNPVGLRGDRAFGQAFYGRLGMGSPLRIVPPANETPRQIQLQLRVSF